MSERHFVHDPVHVLGYVDVNSREVGPSAAYRVRHDAHQIILSVRTEWQHQRTTRVALVDKIELLLRLKSPQWDSKCYLTETSASGCCSSAENVAIDPDVGDTCVRILATGRRHNFGSDFS
jgi:hypothetical protein